MGRAIRRVRVRADVAFIVCGALLIIGATVARASTHTGEVIGAAGLGLVLMGAFGMWLRRSRIGGGPPPPGGPWEGPPSGGHHGGGHGGGGHGGGGHC
jgi:hypothetical protein